MRELLSTGEVCRVLGVGPAVICRWLELGIIRPARRGHGKGNQHIYSLRDVLAIALARDLRRRGFSLRQAGGVCESLLNKPLDAIRADIAAGRRYLITASESVPPVLASRESVDDADLLACHLKGLPLAVIDVGGVLRRIEEAVKADVAAEVTV
ncbi:MAG: MerR family transcriptional regulator [Candidatus Anammoximicrobium sp.]|nr:MerR family transcriptional regulator [Candidatus Anammoximicrobium sp.]